MRVEARQTVILPLLEHLEEHEPLLALEFQDTLIIKRFLDERREHRAECSEHVTRNAHWDDLILGQERLHLAHHLVDFVPGCRELVVASHLEIILAIANKMHIRLHGNEVLLALELKGVVDP